MKKLISIAALAVLTACTAPQEASSIGNGAAAYDMNTVQDYNARVTSGNTVTAREKARVAQRDSVPNEVNASDHRAVIFLLVYKPKIDFTKGIVRLRLACSEASSSFTNASFSVAISRSKRVNIKLAVSSESMIPR